jgi:hypothetical protein
MIITCTINDNIDELKNCGTFTMADYLYSSFHNAFANSLSRDVHRFIQQATWKTWPSPVNKSGTTWIEMFTRFDTQGYRSQESIQHNNSVAHHRFLLRSSKTKRSRTTGTPAVRSANTRPSMALELQTFKSTFKRIIRHYVPEKAQDIFLASTAQHDKRLRNLGLNFHTTAIKGILDTSCGLPWEPGHRASYSTAAYRHFSEENKRHYREQHH